MQEDKVSISIRGFILLLVIATVSGCIASCFFLLPEIDVLLGAFFMCVFCASEGMLLTVAKPLAAMLPIPVCMIAALFTGQMRIDAFLTVAFAFLCASMLALLSVKKAPRSTVFAVMTILFALHILTCICFEVYLAYGSLSADILLDALDAQINAFLDIYRQSFASMTENPMMAGLPIKFDLEEFLDSIAFVIRSNVITAICGVSMLSAAVTTVFYGVAGRLLGKAVYDAVFLSRQWVFLPKPSLARFFYIVYLGYAIFLLFRNDVLYVAFWSLVFIAGMPLAHVGARFLRLNLGAKMRKLKLANLIVYGGIALTALVFGGITLPMSLMAFVGAYATILLDRQKKFFGNHDDRK